MAASQLGISNATPMGANLVAGGASFRVWAPNALSVHVLGDFNNHQLSDDGLLVADGRGYWQGFIAGVEDRQRYIFPVVGTGSEGRKRDP